MFGQLGVAMRRIIPLWSLTCCGRRLQDLKRGATHALACDKMAVRKLMTWLLVAVLVLVVAVFVAGQGGCSRERSRPILASREAG